LPLLAPGVVDSFEVLIHVKNGRLSILFIFFLRVIR